MRVNLKGVHRVRKRLASGLFATYYYAWRGGPRIEAKFGTPEFHQAYVMAHEARRNRPVDTLNAVFRAFEQSSDYAALADRTRKDYAKHLRHIEAEFADFPITALADRRTRGEFLAWRDRVGKSSERTADYRFAILARIIAWALDRGLVPANPCKRPGRLYRGSRAEFIWREAEEAAFFAKAPQHLHLALTLALWTGQRQGDLIKLTWKAYDGTHIRLAQNKTRSKTGKRQLKRVAIPVGAPLKAALDAHKLSYGEQGNALPETILVTLRGSPWTSDGFRTSWRRGCIAAGVAGLTFHDLRGTVVTRLAIAGCSVPQIATITGHSLKDVEAILDAHYLMRDSGLGEAAIVRLENAGDCKPDGKPPPSGSAPEEVNGG
ncbi:integrase [Novosphingobium sp. SG751A]|uniref:site-specific integrase n=1 Tax=Novosphingobium sp. SG751A TaxID=2587000 RepID=UPI001552882A|nr:site-specific integrase [Novosphingobium sp. SG751A]NOW44351.1 integrase [Novosphingobium sp. SG751A]